MNRPCCHQTKSEGYVTCASKECWLVSWKDERDIWDEKIVYEWYEVVNAIDFRNECYEIAIYRGYELDGEFYEFGENDDKF